jgi:hypothetical protein
LGFLFRAPGRAKKVRKLVDAVRRCASVRYFLRFRWSEEVAESAYQQKALTTVTLGSSAEEPPIEPVEVDEPQRIFGFTPTTIIPGSGLDASGNRGGCS